MTTSDALPTRPLDARLRLTSPTAGPLLALSPHLDDLVFSACAPVLARPLDVWTVFAGDADPPLTTGWDRSCGFRDSHHALTTRRDEDTAAFAGTRATVRHLSHLDGPYTTPERRAADLTTLRSELGRWLDAHPGATVLAPAGAGVGVPAAWWERFRRPSRITAAASIPSSTGAAEPGPGGITLASLAMRKRVANAAKETVRGWMHTDYQRRRAAAQRKGLAVNNDHLTVRDVVLEVTASHPGVTVVLYEDLPYLWSQPADDEVARLAGRGFHPIQFSLPVDSADKFQRIQAYASQIDVMDPKLQRLSRPGHLPATERFWHLTQRRSIP